jgi:formyltetrahydrofolate deformylase
VKSRHVLTLSCIDRPGLVAAVAGYLFESGANIVEAQQFDDLATGQFFMRVVFDGESNRRELTQEITTLADRFRLTWRLCATSERQKVVLLVSGVDHCLGDLLYRARIGELKMDVVGIISNHPRMAMKISAIGDTPFHHFPVTKETKLQQEAQIKQVINETEAELVVLARYMQILSADLAAFLAGRCINIHHGFLPGFKGAQPYHQAHAHGVKIIGATAHYVTANLDEGPIIAQDVEHVTHTDTPDDLIRKGRNIEQRVLSRAVHYYLEQRVLLNGNKTVVFRD